MMWPKDRARPYPMWQQQLDEEETLFALELQRNPRLEDSDSLLPITSEGPHH